ncbi:Scr1 family TA system antitoxin-like transcriptional regulator [Thermomonospora catenispora]|uniref:Scr1 family TA system antitoxin-like transcriptional regulator n=1 Tax=Thermomonospora catenispora TaxID=2493090 RepID=UPI00111EB703|nr:Scr1 family TA system antitoxin-like transcriptional regulator [Thermomonospora catenispora]TNY38079.1 XRE family transcriptional regulator [Thermomonospora catenispora]
MGADRLVELGRELRRLRVAAGMSGAELARRAGVPQTTVSRVETGRRVSDAEVVVRLLEALGLGAGEFERLATEARAAYVESAAPRVDAGVSFRRGTAVEQARSASVVRSFESVAVPYLLRTASYDRAAGTVVLGEGGVDRAAVLGDQGRHFTFVICEGVLRTWPGSGACMPEQLAHLVEVAGRANVRLGVVPAGTVVGSERCGVPLHGFTIYDDSAVTVETFTRELTLTAEADVRAYVEVFEGFARSAVFGDEAVALVERAARDLGKILGSIH